MCLTPTCLRRGTGMAGCEIGENGNTCYTVTPRMNFALRWEAKRGTLIRTNCWSEWEPITDQNESQSLIRTRSNCWSEWEPIAGQNESQSLVRMRANCWSEWEPIAGQYKSQSLVRIRANHWSEWEPIADQNESQSLIRMRANCRPVTIWCPQITILEEKSQSGELNQYCLFTSLTPYHYGAGPNQPTAIYMYFRTSLLLGCGKMFCWHMFLFVKARQQTTTGISWSIKQVNFNRCLKWQIIQWTRPTHVLWILRAME